MDRLKYDSDTKSFSKFSGAKSMAKKVLAKTGGQTAGLITNTLGLVTAGAGAIAAGANLKGALSGTKFSVVYKDANGSVRNRTISAKSPVDAISAVRLKVKGSKFRAFRLPDQDDQSQEYYQQLMNE